MTTLTVETWCEALESGDYQQANNRLKCEDAFCCLGVGCDLSGMGEWQFEDGATCYLITGSHHANHVFLPQAVQDVLNLTTIQGHFEFDSLPSALRKEVFAACEVEPVSLTDANDNGASFPLIAKVIRARPKGLFREAA